MAETKLNKQNSPKLTISNEIVQEVTLDSDRRKSTSKRKTSSLFFSFSSFTNWVPCRFGERERNGSVVVELWWIQICCYIWCDL